MRLLSSLSSPSKAFRGVPLRLLLVVPFVLQIFTAVGLTGWFSLRNGQRAVNNLAAQLRDKTSAQVTHHLEDQLLLPHQINQLNLDAITGGALDLHDFNVMGHTFYRQMQIFDVSYINFANPQGEFIGIERLASGELLINERSQQLPDGRLHVYTANDRGDRLSQIAAKPYNPLIEAWYADAAKAGKPMWTDIYQWDDKPEIMSISASYPIYNRQKQLLGIVGVDLILTELSHFLQNVQASPSTEIFIVERNGLLVASSEAEPPFVVKASKAQRMSASQSRNLLINATGHYLSDHFRDLARIDEVQRLSFQANGQTQFVQVTPWRDRYGLNWLVVVVVPESDFMQQIYTNTRITILLCLLSLALAILLGLLTSRWITRRIQQVVQASQTIAAGNLDQTIEVKGIQELEALAKSFNQMATQLKTSFTELEERVNQRTAELVEAKEMAEAANRAKSVFLETMSHELRTPLNAILGFAQVFEHDTSLSPAHQERLWIMRRNGEHLLSLINDLLEISRTAVDQTPSAVNRFDRELRLKTETRSQSSEETTDQRLDGYLAQMPPEWISQLDKAAVKGVDRDILELATQIPLELAPLATSLKVWVADFRFDKVTELVQKVRTNPSQT
ncbi:MAG: HAMP domain-containing protein [Leptolyngbya sp. BL-A-14]